MTRCIGIFIALLLTGCAVHPKIQYVFPAADMDGYRKFTLPRSEIIIGPDDRPDHNPTVSSVPTDEFDQAENLYSFMFREVSGGATSTSVTKVTYIANTRILSEIGVASQDNRSGLIDIAGKAIGLIGLAASTAPAPDADVIVQERINPFDENGQLQDVSARSLSKNKQWKYAIKFKPASKDVVPISEFRNRVSAGQALSVMPYPACIEAVVTLTSPQGTDFLSNIKIADPSRIQTIALPDGTIKMHSQCGFDLTYDSNAGSINTEALGKAVDLLKSLKAGTDKK